MKENVKEATAHWQSNANGFFLIEDKYRKWMRENAVSNGLQYIL